MSPSYAPLSGFSSGVMLFDTLTDGHHAEYIEHLVCKWLDEGGKDRLYVVVPAEFLTKHSDVVGLASKQGDRRVEFIAITPREIDSLQVKNSFSFISHLSFVFNAIAQWRLICRYARKLNVNHCVVMYIDWLLQAPMVLGLRFPCAVSGIYFRPTFHYHSFTNYTSSTWKDKLRAWRQRLLILRAIRHPDLKMLFCLDALAVEFISKDQISPRIIYLPDPVKRYKNEDATMKRLNSSLAIEPGRKKLLLFGALGKRKGIAPLLEAIYHMPSHLWSKLCLLLVGAVEAGESADIKTQIEKLRNDTSVQIILRDEFIPAQEVQPFFRLADLILAPYQHHVGMSGILVRAAVAGKPVLASDYGLMGELTRRHILGYIVDSTKPKEIAKAISHFLTENREGVADTQKMARFAAQNTAKEFSQIIFEQTCLQQNNIRS